MTQSPPFSRVIECLVDDKVGILSGVSEVRAQPGGPAFFHFAAYPSNTLAFSEYANSGPRGAASVDRERGVTQVILDAVTGYCAALVSEEDGKYSVCPCASAPFRCAPPEDFALFSEEQYVEASFPWVPFTRNTPVQWSQAWDPLADETVFIPSAMRFLPYASLLSHGEALIAPASSTGLACHWDAGTAAVEALCDVIECDALALLWQTAMRPPQIRVETLSDANYDLVSRFERTGASVTLLKVEQEFGVPTILAVLSNACASAPARVLAAGTSLDPEASVRKSLEMLAHVQQYCQLLTTQLPRVESVPGKIADQCDHLNFWCDHQNARHMDFLFASNERIEFDELPNFATGSARRDCARLLERIHGVGYRGLLANLTTPDIADLGLTVTRAVVAGLQPLFYGFRTRALGGRRLRERLGRLALSGEAGDYPLPHPFPRKGMAS
jgi:ribosomal protein S12 methylthiotransferase accessory factor